MARSLNLEFGPEVVVMTAAGPIKAWVTRLERVSLGAISRENVRATITSGPMQEVLLGMSFLKHFTIRQQGALLTIENATSGQAQTLEGKTE